MGCWVPHCNSETPWRWSISYLSSQKSLSIIQVLTHSLFSREKGSFRHSLFETLSSRICQEQHILANYVIMVELTQTWHGMWFGHVGKKTPFFPFSHPSCASSFLVPGAASQAKLRINLPKNNYIWTVTSTSCSEVVVQLTAERNVRIVSQDIYAHEIYITPASRVATH